jgi:thiol-disulfide isomerase/thioredoxin
MENNRVVSVLLAITVTAGAMYFIAKKVGVTCSSEGHCMHTMAHEKHDHADDHEHEKAEHEHSHPMIAEPAATAVTEEVVTAAPAEVEVKKEAVTPLKTRSEFEELVLKNDKPVAVKVFATWCQPCKSMAPHFKKVAREFADTVAAFDLEYESFDGKDVVSIESFPTTIFYKNGIEISRIGGARDADQLRAEFNKLIS